MTVSEALGQGLEVVAVGLIIVFSVLLILMVVLMLMKVFFYKEPKQQKDASAPIPAAASAEAKSKSEKIDDGELIAVLTAAVAACLNTSTYNLNIKSFRRVSDKSPAWNRAGRTDVINSRF